MEERLGSFSFCSKARETHHGGHLRVHSSLIIILPVVSLALSLPLSPLLSLILFVLVFLHKDKDRKNVNHSGVASDDQEPLHTNV